MLATVFRIFTFELDMSDASMAHAHMVPYPKFESKGYGSDSLCWA